MGRLGGLGAWGASQWPASYVLKQGASAQSCFGPSPRFGRYVAKWAPDLDGQARRFRALMPLGKWYVLYN